MNAARQARQAAKEADPAGELKKQLRIKTGTFARLRKEVQMYEREVTEQQEKVGRMRQEGSDEADIHKQVEILEESRNMIPDAQTRLEQAKQSLEEQLDVVESAEQAEVVKESNEWRAACEALGL
jgi:tubulin-specific chaperone A